MVVNDPPLGVCTLKWLARVDPGGDDSFNPVAVFVVLVLELDVMAACAFRLRLEITAWVKSGFLVRRFRALQGRIVVLIESERRTLLAEESEEPPSPADHSSTGVVLMNDIRKRPVGHDGREHGHERFTLARRDPVWRKQPRLGWGPAIDHLADNAIMFVARELGRGDH